MVLRRYTPPTCTLEITAKKSPLSRWTNQAVLKDLSFQLNFDDPRLPTEEQVVIKGDREQLEALCKVVETYIQNFLIQSTNLLNSAILTPAIESKEYLSIAENNNSQIREDAINNDEELEDNKFQIYLKPKGLLNHELFLGTLADVPNSSINLTALQLFDLANALDEYNNDIVTLPEIDRPKWIKKPPVWVSIAAVLVLTVGLTPAIVKLFNRSSNQKVASNETNQNQPVPNSQQINSSVNQNPGQIPPPLPPGVTTPIPTPPGVAPTPAKNASPNSQTPTPTATPTLLQPPPIPTTTKSDVNQPNSGEKTPPPAPAPAPAPAQQQIVINPQTAVIPDIIPSAPTPQTPINTAPAPEPFFFPTVPKTNTQPPLPEPIITSQTPKTEAPKPLTPAPQPNTNGILPPARLPEVNLENDKYNSGVAQPGAMRSQNSKLSNSSNTSNQNEENSSRKIASPSLPIGSSDGISNNTVFGNNSQVMEIKDYFQKRWTPPQDLNRTLEYSLLLNTDGSIKEVKALTEISAKYIDITNMPSIGQPFVSAPEGKNAPKIRLFLSPDGKVQTFLESSN